MQITPQQFADQTNIDQGLAKKILDSLYAKGMDAKAFDRVLWRLRSMLEKTMLVDLINKSSQKQIDDLITEMQIEDQSYGPAECSENTKAWIFNAYEFKDKSYKCGDNVEIQIMRTGKWKHPQYGEFEITESTLDDVVKNFNSNVRKVDLAVDENHDPNHVALGWFRKLAIQGKDALFATIELTKKGADLLSQGAYKYFSPEIIFNKTDEETGKNLKNLLIGGAFTNRPFFKAMQGLMASEDATDNQRNTEGGSQLSESNILFSPTQGMFKLYRMMGDLAEKEKITASEMSEFNALFSQISEVDKTEEVQKAFNEIKAKFDESQAADSGTAAGDEGGDKGTRDGGQGEGASGESADTAADTGTQQDTTQADNAGAADNGGTVKATEDEVTVKASEVKTWKENTAELAKLIAAARRADTQKRVEGMAFSEANKTVAILPKYQKDIVDFAVSLSEKSAEKFLQILGNVTKLSLGEIGTDKGNSTENAKFAETVAFYATTMHMEEKDAIKAAEDALGITPVKA